jgi:hypothetical protein
VSLQAQQNAQTEDVYTIVPVDGLTGTTRRPIVIECLEDRINLVSEGITLTSADLDGFIPPFNPLAAGVKALGGAWYARDGEDPYVLLIVRPQGTVTFYVARMFLTASRVPFGYELVTADRKLNWPKSDEAVTAACRAAIDDMLRRRNEVPEMSGLAGGAGEVVHLRGSDGAFRLAEVEELRQPPGRTVQFGGQRLDRDAFTQGSGEPSEPVEAERGGGGVFRRSSQEEPQAGDRSARPGRLPVHPLPQGTARDRPVSGTAAGGSQRSGERSWMSPLSTGIAVQRDVKIAVEANQIRVEGERPVRVEGGTTSTEMAEATVDAVDRVIQTWKPAPQGFYWKPRIQFVVSPGAVQRYAALNRAMQTWGIDTSVEYVQPQTAGQPVGTGQGTQRR